MPLPTSPHSTKPQTNFSYARHGESSAPEESPKQRKLHESWDALVTVQSPILDETSEVEAINPLPAPVPSYQPHFENTSESFLARDSVSDLTIAASYHTTDGQQMDPFLDSQTMLQTIGHQLAINDREHVLLALQTLSEGIKQHKYELMQCL